VKIRACTFAPACTGDFLPTPPLIQYFAQRMKRLMDFSNSFSQENIHAEELVEQSSFSEEPLAKDFG